MQGRICAAWVVGVCCVFTEAWLRAMWLGTTPFVTVGAAACVDRLWLWLQLCAEAAACRCDRTVKVKDVGVSIRIRQAAVYRCDSAFEGALQRVV